MILIFAIVLGAHHMTMSYGILRFFIYDSIMDNMTELVERSDPNYNLTCVNKALADYYGYTQEELIGTDTMELVEKEDRATIYQMMESIDAEHPHYRYQYRVKNKNGETAWMESVGCGFYDENGIIIEYQDIGRDITHFKDMEHLLTHEVEQRTKELKRANRKLMRLNRSAPKFIDRNLMENWVREGSVDIKTRCDEEARRILETHNPAPLSEYAAGTIREIIEKEERDLGIIS